MKALAMRHILIFTLIVIPCFSTSLLWSQTTRGDVERDLHRFRKQFDEVANRGTEEVAGSNGERFFSPNPERLPHWLFLLPSDTESYTYVVSASDPGMETQAAKELAIMRAQMIFGLLSVTHVGHIREYYTTELDSDITHFFTEFTRFISRLNTCVGQIEIVRKHRTQYDETIILARIPINTDTSNVMTLDQGQVEAGLYTRLRGVGNRMEIEEHLQMEVTPELGTAGRNYHHQYAMINRVVNTSTIVDDMLLTDLPALNLRYIFPEGDRQNIKTGSSNKGGISLRNGFWHALIASLLSSMVDEAHDGSIHFANLNEMYNLMMLSMSRELMQKTLISSMPKIFVDDNTLYLHPFVQQIFE